MGYIEIVEMDEYGVSATDLSDLSDSVRQEIWIALIKGEVK